MNLLVCTQGFLVHHQAITGNSKGSKRGTKYFTCEAESRSPYNLGLKSTSSTQISYSHR